MRDFVVNKTPWFALAWFGSVIAGTGLGALAISAGAALMVVVYAELVLQLALVLAVALSVPDRFGGFAASVLTMVLPFGAFVAWAEASLSKAPTTAATVVSLGAALVCVAAWRAFTPRWRLLRRAVTTAWAQAAAPAGRAVTSVVERTPGSARALSMGAKASR